MIDEPDNLLSAYIDDELSAAERRTVDAGLAADPVRAAELRKLAAVRDLVAGLGRPASPGVTAEVVRRIAQSSHALGSADLSVGRRYARLAWAAVAAAAVLGVFLTAKFSSQNSEIAVASLAGNASKSQASRPRTSTVGAIPSVAAMRPESPASVVAPSPAVAEVARLGVGRELFDRDGPYRIFLVSTADGGFDDAEAATQLQHSSHRDFYRFEAPDGAAVYAAEVDPNELRTLRLRLGSAFAGRVEEKGSEATIMADVAALGRSSTFRSEPAGEVLFPDGEMALRTPGEPGDRGDGERKADEARAGVEPERHDEASGPRTDDRPSVVVIWLIAPPTP